MCGLNIKHMIEEGGITAQADKAAKRSQMLYDYIDSSDGYYSNNIHKQFRSKMNIPFRVKMDENLEKKFEAEARAEGLLDLAGHRSVGGCRASLYNAMSFEVVEALINFMKAFREKN